MLSLYCKWFQIKGKQSLYESERRVGSPFLSPRCTLKPAGSCGPHVDGLSVLNVQTQFTHVQTERALRTDKVMRPGITEGNTIGQTCPRSCPLVTSPGSGVPCLYWALHFIRCFMNKTRRHRCMGRLQRRRGNGFICCCEQEAGKLHVKNLF